MESASNVMASDVGYPNNPPNSEVAWMFSVNELHNPLPLKLKDKIFQTISARGGEIAEPDLWVLDGAVTTNLSNGIGFIPGTKRPSTTTIEVVGRTHIKCLEVADFMIDAWKDGAKVGEFILRAVPILKTLKYNLISEKYFTSKRLSVIKTGRDCWLLDEHSGVVGTAYLAQAPPLYFFANSSNISARVSKCPWMFFFFFFFKPNTRFIRKD